MEGRRRRGGGRGRGGGEQDKEREEKGVESERKREKERERNKRDSVDASADGVCPESKALSCACSSSAYQPGVRRHPSRRLDVPSEGAATERADRASV